MYNQNIYNGGCNGRFNGIDYGPAPLVTNINCAAKQNCNYRTALWNGNYLQCTLMNVPAYGKVGPMVHNNADQILCIEEGCGRVMIGDTRNRLNFQTNVCKDSAICIPAGTWCDLINTGNCPLKCFSVYAPSE